MNYIVQQNKESNSDFLNCLLLFSVSDFHKFVDMRDFCFLLVYVILIEQTSSQTISCSSNIGSGSDLTNSDSDFKKAVEACIQNIEQCTNEQIVFPSSTATPEVMTSDSTNPMTSQKMSRSSKANDKK